jgi:hypothetical protein
MVEAVGADYDFTPTILLGQVAVAAIRNQFAATFGNHFFNRQVRVEIRHFAFSWVAFLYRHYTGQKFRIQAANLMIFLRRVTTFYCANIMPNFFGTGFAGDCHFGSPAAKAAILAVAPPVGGNV